MENIAFTTLVILLFALPGYVARAVYYSEDFTREVVAKHLSEEIYLAILYSLPFHVTSFLLIDWSYITFRSNIFVDLEEVVGFLTGRFSKEGDGVSSLADNLYAHASHITFYFLGVALIAGATGRILRAAVWRFKLDVRLPSIFRYNNRWLYTFTGRDMKSKESLLGIIDAMCLLAGDKTRLYRGVVVGFDSNMEGNLEQIRLGLAYRGKFKDGTKEFYWEEIPGNVFVLKYNTVQSLNVTYMPASSFNPNSPSFEQGVPETAPDLPLALPPHSPHPEPSSTSGLSQEPHE